MWALFLIAQSWSCLFSLNRSEVRGMDNSSQMRRPRLRKEFSGWVTPVVKHVSDRLGTFRPRRHWSSRQSGWRRRASAQQKRKSRSHRSRRGVRARTVCCRFRRPRPRWARSSSRRMAPRRVWDDFRNWRRGLPTEAASAASVRRRLGWPASRSSAASGQGPAFAKATAGNLRASHERRLAERKGFEPLEAFRLQRFSRPPP